MPWGFNEGWGFSPGTWSADLATEQIELAGTIMPDSLSADRLHVNWREVEFTRDQYNWTKSDHDYQTMQANSVVPVMVIYQAPEWARDPAATCPAQVPCAYPPLPEYDAEWEQFVKDAVSRYPNVRAIEVWNEPNLGRFWAPSPDPGRYAEVLARAHDAAAAAGSDAPVITGGLSPVTGTNATRTSSREFLRETYNQGDAGDFEGIGAHSYPATEPLVDELWRELDRLFGVRDNHADPGTPLWITEVSVSSDSTVGVGPERQGDELVRLYRSIEGHEIESFIIHRLHDGTDATPFFNQTGVVGEDLSPKPAYCELAAAIGDSCPVVKSYLPTAYARISGSVYSGRGAVSRLYSDDGSRVEISAAKKGTSYAAEIQPYASITAEERASLQKLSVEYDGNASSSGAAVTLLIRNFRTGQWQTLDGPRTGVTSDRRFSWSNSTAPTDYVSGSGEVRFAVRGTHSSRFRTRTDLVSFTIES